MATRIELGCTFCGHSAGEVLVRGPGRPSFRELRSAYEAQRPSGAPLWVGDQARCPRCRGPLFVEGLGRASLRTAS